VEAMEPVKFLW